MTRKSHIKSTFTKYMLEVVPGCSNTGTCTVIRQRLATLRSKTVCFPLYGWCVEKENVDIDLILIQSFLQGEKMDVPPIKIPLNCTF